MTIAIVDDHQLIVDGFVSAVLQTYPDSRIHTASDERGLFTLLKQEAIDILFLDIRLHRSDARDFMKKLRTGYPKLKIIIISSLSDLPTIETLFKQGTDGYLLKSDPKAEISRAIKTVSEENEKFMSKGVESRYFAHNIVKSHQPTHLTPREKEILAWILKGKTTKEISDAIFISEKTIENHRANLFIKFDVKNVASLVKKAILEGHL
ncbi:MAG TPA: response regulator transcription factor [Chitinophagaceae bacterium]|nr:response regulator transcription factor [Chitinophagaceae bacterium]